MGIRPTTRTTRTTTTSAVTATAEPRSNTYCKTQEECIFARRQVEYSQTISFQKIIESICTPHARNGLQACSLFICFSLSRSLSFSPYTFSRMYSYCVPFFFYSLSIELDISYGTKIPLSRRTFSSRCATYKQHYIHIHWCNRLYT